MICVCNKHVKSAIQMLNSPHVSKVNIHAKCYFCEEVATYRIYYYDYIIVKTKHSHHNVNKAISI
ncbi:hypothetical protein PMEGAPL128_58880 [Priestia megaterium]